MSILRTAYALRTMSGVVAKRNLAILPTVKKATDTSEMDFPAPSHVSLTSDAAALAHELASFYSDPDSVIKLSEETRQTLQAEITKKVKSMPDTPLTEDWAAANLYVPNEVRLGDNPYFEAYKKTRGEGKLA